MKPTNLPFSPGRLSPAFTTSSTTHLQVGGEMSTHRSPGEKTETGVGPIRVGRFVGLTLVCGKGEDRLIDPRSPCLWWDQCRIHVEGMREIRSFLSRLCEMCVPGDSRFQHWSQGISSSPGPIGGCVDPPTSTVPPNKSDGCPPRPVGPPEIKKSAFQ